MQSYSQNQEDVFIKDYFGDYKGTLLEIGANDGLTLSNSRLLIENDWTAHLVEPASVFTDLKSLYECSKDVHCYNMAVGDQIGFMAFYESGAHVRGGKDKALVSTLKQSETQRWFRSGVKFENIEVYSTTFKEFWTLIRAPKFDFISIDAEGFDWSILQQIDLYAVGCKCLIIEHNGDEGLKTDFCEYCEPFGLKPALVNAENIIFIR